MKRILIVVTLILIAALAGCGDGSGVVKGTVTLDGQPVSNGGITFVKTEGGLIREGAVIKDGSFEARMPPGKYRIELTGQKVVGKRKQKGFSGEDEEIVLAGQSQAPQGRRVAPRPARMRCRAPVIELLP